MERTKYVTRALVNKPCPSRTALLIQFFKLQPRLQKVTRCEVMVAEVVMPYVSTDISG
jgi:hypothetical protein